MKHKINEKVRIKQLDQLENCHEMEVSSGMLRYAGCVATIVGFIEDYYRINIDDQSYIWSDEMFEDETSERKMPERKFKCRDEVIFRCRLGAIKKRYWTFGIFSHYQYQGNYVAIGNNLYDRDSTDILPYEGNEHLVGTTNDPDGDEEVLIKGELVYAFDSIEEFERIDMAIGKVKCINDGSLFVSDQPFTYCIPFAKFNPDDMGATRREILIARKEKLYKAFQ